MAAAPTPCHPQQHIHQLRSSWPSSTTVQLQLLILLQGSFSPAATGADSARESSAPGPSKSPVGSFPLRICSPATVTQLRTSPAPGRNGTGSGPGGRSEAGGRAEATCAACHICKGSTPGSASPGSPPAAPQVPPSPPNHRMGSQEAGLRGEEGAVGLKMHWAASFGQHREGPAPGCVPCMCPACMASAGCL